MVSVFDDDSDAYLFKQMGLQVKSVDIINNTKEIFVILPDFPNYEISTLGRLKNKNGKILKFRKGVGGRGGDEYYRTNLYRGNGPETKNIHQLVLKTFQNKPNNTQTLIVDHINHNTLDNSLSNLRWATYSENAINVTMYTTNTSGVKGVSYVPSRNRFMVVIQSECTKKHIGYYKTLQEATIARRDAEIKYHGDYRPIET